MSERCSTNRRGVGAALLWVLLSGVFAGAGAAEGLRRNLGAAEVDRAVAHGLGAASAAALREPYGLGDTGAQIGHHGWLTTPWSRVAEAAHRAKRRPPDEELAAILAEDTVEVVIRIPGVDPAGFPSFRVAASFDGASRREIKIPLEVRRELEDGPQPGVRTGVIRATFKAEGFPPEGVVAFSVLEVFHDIDHKKARKAVLEKDFSAIR